MDRPTRKALIDEILRLDSRIFELAKRTSPPGWFELDLTMAQLKILFLLLVADTANMGTLARTMGVAVPSVTGVVDRLIERGLVTRRENPEDRREVLVELTGSGRDLAHRLYRAGRLQWEFILDHLSDDELRLVDQAMKAVYRAAKEGFGGPPLPEVGSATSRSDRAR